MKPQEFEAGRQAGQEAANERLNAAVLAFEGCETEGYYGASGRAAMPPYGSYA